MDMDIVKILGYGVSGLGFLLAFLAYRLLSQAQRNPSPSSHVFRAIYVFMAFSFALCILGLASQFFNGRATSGHPDVPVSHPDDFIPSVTSDATKFSNESAMRPYPDTGYPNDADKLEALIQEFLANALLHPDIPFDAARPFYQAMDQAVTGFEMRAQSNIQPANDNSFSWHTHDSPEWFRTHLHELRAEHESDGIDVPGDTVRKYQKIFRDWRQGVGIDSRVAS